VSEDEGSTVKKQLTFMLKKKKKTHQGDAKLDQPTLGE